jgi:glycosyltransferase involved in cell wall biosynthesis
MKILLVTQYFWPENFKGNDIAFDLAKRGHCVTVLTSKPNYPKGNFYDGYNFFNKRKETVKGVKIIRVPIIPRLNGKGLPLIMNYLSFVFFSFFAVIFRVPNDFDAVFVQQLSPVTMALPGIWAKRKSNCPLYLWVLDLWPESVSAASNISNVTIMKLLDILVNYIYNSSDKILISSNFFKSSIKPRLKDKNKPIIYFPNWAEDVFTVETIKNYSIPNLLFGHNIMFAGNIGESQDFISILEVIKATQNLKVNWIIVGDGRKFSWLKREVEKNKLQNVHLLGRYPLEQMPNFFSIANSMLVSLKDEPVFSLTVPAKIQAYMASSKVVLGMLNGEGKELINSSGCGFAVNAGDYEGLTTIIKELITLDPSRINEMELKSKEYYLNHFDKSKLLNQLEHLLNR